MAINRDLIKSKGKLKRAAVNPAVAEAPKRVGRLGPSVMGSFNKAATPSLA